MTTLSYSDIYGGYSAIIPKHITINDIQSLSPRAETVVRRVIDNHFSDNRDGQFAVCATTAAFVCCHELVKKRLRSNNLSLREKEIFTLLNMYDKELKACNISNKLFEISSTL